MSISTRDSWTLFLLSLAFCLSTADGIFTHILIEYGVAAEANPWMAWLLEIGGWPLFWVYKGPVVFLAASLIWWMREHPFAVWAAGCCSLSYSVLYCWWLYQFIYVVPSL